MMKRQLLYIIALIMFYSLSSCTGSSTSKNKYTNGKYNAEIKYYNPKTGTHSEYTLKVEIEDDLLVKIYWSNGGWLDNSHFTPPNISTGTATFISDKNYRYKVRILDDDEYRSSKYYDSDEVCPNCGEEKDSYDDYCGDCLEEIEKKTCPNCGDKKYSWDDLCDDCQKEADDNTCSLCGSYKYSYDEYCEDCLEDESY